MITLSEGLIRQARIMKWTGLIMLPCVVAIFVVFLTLTSVGDDPTDRVRSFAFTFGVLLVAGGIFLITGVAFVLLVRRNARQVDPASPGYYPCSFGLVDMRKLALRGSIAIAASKGRSRQVGILKWVDRIVIPCAWAGFLIVLAQLPFFQAYLPASIRGPALGGWVLPVVAGVGMTALLVCSVLVWCRACRTDTTMPGDQEAGHDASGDTEPMAGEAATTTVSEGLLRKKRIMKCTIGIALPCCCLFILAIFLGSSWAMLVPVGVWMVAGSITSVLLGRNGRRIDFTKPGCQACGYDVTDNTSGTCPECGISVEQSSEPGNSRASHVQNEEH